MKLPYGLSNFRSLRNEGYLYIDKTAYLEILENLSSRYLFFIRPRRFGKSLFLSTLAHYYDLNTSNEFEKLFGDLYIGKNPTGDRNSYLVLELDFSGLNTASKAELEKSFRMKLTNKVLEFINKYQRFFSDISTLEDRIRTMSDVSAILDILIGEVKKTSHRIYLIIDEYDHFANDIIAMGDGAFYKEIIRATGLVRDFYETVKIGTKSVIDRIFITGISPIMLDDLTSGFNIASNITMDEAMNEMMGFTERELSGIINRLGIKPEENGVKLNEYYNGYLFNVGCGERVYNPDMILYYFDQFIRTNKQPRQLIDDNVKTDYGRLNRLTSNQDNRKVLEGIIKNEGITADIVTKFSFDRMYDPDYFVSLLFYMGLLTIDRQEKTSLLLKIPNYVVKTIYWEYIENSLKQEYHIYLETGSLRKSIEEMAYEGRIEPYIKFISNQVLKILSNRDTIEFDEKYLKVILFSYLITSRAYKLNSEKEVESGYIDIFLERDIRMPGIKYEWVIELKYLKKSEINKLAQVREAGLKQLKRYAESDQFRDKTDLKQALLIFIGKDEYQVVESPFE
jgi:hypothetical protein